MCCITMDPKWRLHVQFVVMYLLMTRRHMYLYQSSACWQHNIRTKSKEKHRTWRETYGILMWFFCRVHTRLKHGFSFSFRLWRIRQPPLPSFIRWWTLTRKLIMEGVRWLNLLQLLRQTLMAVEARSSNLQKGASNFKRVLLNCDEIRLSCRYTSWVDASSRNSGELR